MISEATKSKITRRIMPFLMVLYITAHIDRANVGFAGLSMTKDLNFSNEVFGFGAGIFFLGYCLLQIPGAMLAQNWSARKWLSAVMVFWGFVAAGTGLIRNATEFGTLRFLLGLAEGGFFPAVIVYLTHWFTNDQRGKAVALFMAGIPASNIIGAPISGLLLQVHWLGVAGWRWLLILEGIPAILGGILTLFYLPDRPADARWMRPEEREWITTELRRESQEKKSSEGGRIWAILRNPIVILVTVSYFMINTSFYGVLLWLPKIVQKIFATGSLRVGLIVAIPYLVSAPAMFLNGWHSDKTGERRWHAAFAATAAGAGLALSQAFDGSPVLALAALTVAAVGILAFYPPMWALPTQALSERTAAASYGFINLVSNLGGFLGPYAIGYLTDRTGSFAAGIYVLVATALLGAVAIVCVRHKPTPKTVPDFAAEVPTAWFEGHK